MSTAFGSVVVLPSSAFPAGQISLINYVNTLGQFDVVPFTRDVFHPENMPEKALASILAGQLPALEGYFLSAAGLVARAVRHERVLSQALGPHWRLEARFVPAVRRDLNEIRNAVRPAHEELKAWRKALKGYNFEGYQDPSETFDIREEETLRGLLIGMQSVFQDKVLRAREVMDSYGPRSLLGIEGYFGVARHRRSGPVPVLVAPQNENSKDFILRDT